MKEVISSRSECLDDFLLVCQSIQAEDLKATHDKAETEGNEGTEGCAAEVEVDSDEPESDLENEEKTCGDRLQLWTEKMIEWEHDSKKENLFESKIKSTLLIFCVLHILTTS